MPNPLGLIQHAISQPLDSVATGTVSHFQPAPTSFASPLYVTVDGWTPDFYLTVHKWVACNGSTLPAAGNEVLLVKTAPPPPTQPEWVCVWWAGSVTNPQTQTIVVAPPSGDTTGATDATSISQAITALGGSGTLQFRKGAYYDNGQRNHDSTINVRYQGVGGSTTGSQPATRLTYTGSAAPYISARSSYGFTLTDMQVLYSNTSLTGLLFDFSHATASDTQLVLFERAYLGGSGISTAPLVGLDNAVIVTFRDTNFANGTWAVRGRSASAIYSNVVKFEGNCTFNNFTSAPILNPGQAWSIKGATFEQLNGGGAGAISSSLSGISGLAMTGCWFGDANSTGIWIDAALSGASIKGNYFSAGNTAVNLHASSSGVTISGNTFDTMSTGIALGVNCSGIDPRPNFYNNVTTPVSYAALPASSIYTDAAGRLNASQLWCRDGVATLTGNTTGLTSAQIDALFTLAPVDGMGLVDTTNNIRLERISGKWYKTAALTLIP